MTVLLSLLLCCLSEPGPSADSQHCKKLILTVMHVLHCQFSYGTTLRVNSTPVTWGSAC
jgi:hypothetical protein